MRNKGFTLIEVMVAVAISGAVILAFLGMLTGILKTQKYVTQRYEIQDLNNLVRLGMMQSNFCDCNFPTAMDLTPARIPVTTLNYFAPGGCTTTSGTLISAAANNNLVPGTSTGLKIQNIQLQNLQLLSQPTPATNFYSFDLQVDFDPATTTIQMKPMVVSGLTMITSVGAAPLQKISSCATSALGGSTLTATQLCLMLGGAFLQTGKCAFPSLPGSNPPGGTETGTNPGTGTPTTPTGPPSGTVIAQCYTAPSSGVVNCTGGAALPNKCPSGTNLSDYYSVTGITTQFKCVVP